MKKWHQVHAKCITLLCAIALFAGSILVPSADVVQGKTKKPVLNKKKLSLLPGKTAKIKVKNAGTSKVTWKIKNKKIAKIKTSGKTTVKVTAKKKGKTTLTAKLRKGSKRFTLRCKITVNPAANPSATASADGDDRKQQPPAGTQAPAQSPDMIPAASSDVPTASSSPSSAASQTPVPAQSPAVTPTTAPTLAPAVTTKPSQTPSATPAATPSATAAATPTLTPEPTEAPTQTPAVTDNVLEGSTVKNTGTNVTASVQNGKATAEFAKASQYKQADFTLAESFALSNVTSIQYTLTVSGTPDSVCFKLYGTDGNELSSITQYNKKSGSYTISVPEDLKDKTVGGYAIMTNSDIEGTTQTATATLESLTYKYTEEAASGTALTMSSETHLTSSSVSGNPVYNSDGSVTFTVTQQYGGGGLGVSLNTSKTAVDLSDYSKVIFKISAETADAPVTLNYFTSSDFWSGRKDMMTTLTTTTPKEVTCSIPYGTNICGFGVKYNTYGYDTSTLPQELTITIHSITLVKDTKDITDATTNYSKLYELAADYGFKMGTVMNTTTISDPKYSKLMQYHFNSITAANEMKAYSMLSQSASRSAYTDETSMPVLNFDNADKIMDYAKENGLKLRGHTLVWDAGMSDWFFRVGYDSSNAYASKEVMKARLKNYIEQVITHFEEKYPGVIYCWDVVNEAVGDKDTDYEEGDSRHVRKIRGDAVNLFYETIGSDYVELSFQYAYEVIEDLRKETPEIDIKLYYNDYNTFYSDKRDAICELVRSVNSYLSDGASGYVKLCDGVGMQSYIGGFGQQDGCMNDSDINLVKTAIQKFASLDIEVQVTELAVRNYKNDAETLAKHAEFYKKLFQAYLDINSGDEKPLTAVTIWGIVDNPDLDPEDYSFTMNGTYCGLFDENLGVKGAFINIHDLMKNES